MTSNTSSSDTVTLANLRKPSFWQITRKYIRKLAQTFEYIVTGILRLAATSLITLVVIISFTNRLRPKRLGLKTVGHPKPKQFFYKFQLTWVSWPDMSSLISRCFSTASWVSSISCSMSSMLVKREETFQNREQWRIQDFYLRVRGRGGGEGKNGRLRQPWYEENKYYRKIYSM